MAVSPYSIVMALLWFTGAALIGCFMLRKAEKYGLALASLIFILAVLRASLPIDFSGSIVIRSEKIYPMLKKLLSIQVFGDITLGRGFLLLWGLGVSIQFVCFLKKCVQQARFLQRVSHENSNKANKKLFDLFREVSNELGYRGKWELTISAEVSAMYQAGFLRPHLLLPESIEECSEQDICNVFRHELQHFLGKDLWIKTGVQIAACVLWWNPVVRLLNRGVLQLLELLCDKRVCKNLSEDEQADYLETLLHFLKNTTLMPKNSMALSYLGNPMDSGVKQRFQLMLRGKPSVRSKVRLWTGCILCVLLFIMSYWVVLQPAFPPPTAEDGFEMIILTPQNAYILHTKSGEYIVYYNNDFHAILASEESLRSPPHCNLQIIEEGDEKT